MFSTAGLFSVVPCPDARNCRRPRCIFSHQHDAKEPFLPQIPVKAATPYLLSSGPPKGSVIPSKRAVAPSTPPGPSSNGQEPPKKLQKLGPTTQKSVVTLVNGVPRLNVNPALSQVPVPVRQTMLKTLFDHFTTLYEHVQHEVPDLASRHALEQESEVYTQSTKLTYRNAMISSVAALKRRPKPDSFHHDSVGTEGDIKKRKEQRESIHNLILTRSNINSCLLSMELMTSMGYIVKIPEGPGGDKPSQEGEVRDCERCGEKFTVSGTPTPGECNYHWGKPFTSRINGERVRVYKCCSSLTSESGGCTRGQHVFSESSPEVLHSRHPFSPSRVANGEVDLSGETSAPLEIVALDCEMIHSTAGLSVARVSVVDGAGVQVLDEVVKMDDGVEVVDFNTRFSGITPEVYSKAVLTLSSLRHALDAFVDSDTIIIGHSLENDLKTLRMIHHKCVDTVVLFPHAKGLPFRRALRDLVRENLNQIIQTGGAAAGHSSLEDAIATLNLVRWHIASHSKGPKPGVSSGT